MRFIAVLLLALVLGQQLRAQSQQTVYTGGAPVSANIPTNCALGMNYNGSTFSCVQITSGTVQLRMNACLTGWTQQDALADKMLLMTTSAAGDAGATGGSNSITPTVNSLTAAAPTVNSLTAAAQTHTGITASFTGQAATLTGAVAAPVFTGNTMATHQHELPLQIISSTSQRFLTAVFGTGTSRAASGANTTSANGTSAPVALSEAKSAGTPAGTNSVPALTMNSYTPLGTVTMTSQGTNGTSSVTGTLNSSSVTGTLNSFDNRSAWVKVIMCVKD